MKIKTSFKESEFKGKRVQDKTNPLSGDVKENQQVFDAFPEEIRKKIEELIDDIEKTIAEEVANIVNSAPEALDTLKELADALGNDANFATTMYTELGGKVDIIDGKGLSTEDYTTEEKEKLAGLTNVVQDEEYVHTDNNYTDAEKGKLAKIKELVRIGFVNNEYGYTNFRNFETFETEEPAEGILYIDIAKEENIKCYIWLDKWVEVSPQINLGEGVKDAYSGYKGKENADNIKKLNQGVILNAKFLGTITSIKELNEAYGNFLEFEAEPLDTKEKDKYFNGRKIDFLANEAFLQALGITAEECPIGVEAGLYNYGIPTCYTQYLEISSPYMKLYKREWDAMNDEASIFGWITDFTEVTDFCKKSIGEKSEGENSAIFGSTRNKFEKLKLPVDLYYKPIADEYYEYAPAESRGYNYGVMAGFGYIDGTFDYTPVSSSFSVGDICLLIGNVYDASIKYGKGEEFSGYVRITSVSNSDYWEEIDEQGNYVNSGYTDYGHIYFEAISEFPEAIGDNHPVYSSIYTLQKVNAVYKFENLTFTTDDTTDTLLDKLYTYTDLWGNKCYTVYKNYTPDIADGSTNDANGNPRTSKVYELTEDKSLEDEENGILHDSEFMLRGLRYEALFNKGTYFAVADGENAFSSGEDNVASGDDTFSVGYRNIVLADGSTALGRRILVRGVGANGFGLNGKVTGRYAIAFNEGGQALGYASVVFGDHCKALDYYDVAGGFQSVAKGNTSFAFGRNVIASGFGAVALGQLTVADGKYCIVGGNKNECFGDYSFVTGLLNIVNGEHCIVGGQKNVVDGTASIVGGISNTNTGRWGLMSGTQNSLGGQNSAVIGAGNLNNGINGAFVAGQQNKNEGERSSIIGGISNYISASANDSLAFGNNVRIEAPYSIGIGTNIQSDDRQCWSIGRRLKTARDRQIILGIGNEEDSSAMLIIGAGSNNDTDTNAIRLNALTVRQTTGYVEIPKLVLVSPNKNKFMLKVSDDGTLSTERVY